jgi:hypothetical protein
MPTAKLPRHAVVLVAALAAALAAPPAAARPAFLLGARAGYADLGDSDVFPAVYDTSLSPWGAQAEARWSRWFTRLAYETATADGFLVQPTGVPLLPAPAEPTELTLDLLHLTVGAWGSGPGRWGWYAGAGATFADATESNVTGERSESGTGVHALVGARRALGERWEVGLEAMALQVGDLFVPPPPADAGDLVSFGAAAVVSFRF